ncbi:MAG: hypothetical protein NTZ33_15780 [Bacteroidetes bacterium]|nr:hypothetical protein [Bacteroidota bacterium]
MNFKKIVDSLTEDQFLELDKIISERKAIKQANITFEDFIKEHKHQLSIRMFNALNNYSKEYKFINELNRKKLLKTPNIGAKSVTEFENLLKRFNYNLENYYS